MSTMALAVSTITTDFTAAPASVAFECPAAGRQWLIPSFSDAFFWAVFIWLFLAGPSGWKALLMDGDTGWHIRAGEYILDHHAVPRHDLFSFSMLQAPWFAWEWLSDIVFAGVFRLGGLKAVVLLAGFLIGIFAVLLLRCALWHGADVLTALTFTLLAIGSASMHFLARPHLFTLVFLTAAVWLLAADRLRPRVYLWLLIPVTTIWANLHGGFAIFLALLGLLLAGACCEARFLGRSWTAVRRYALLLAGCSAATLITPYGIGLHQHIFEYLRSDWIRDLVQEFQAPTFRSEGQFQFEILLFTGLAVAARLLRKGKCIEAFWIVFLAHCSLTSVRHVPLYAAVAAPVIAGEISNLWRSCLGPRRNSICRILLDLGHDLMPPFRRNSIGVAAFAAVLVCSSAPFVWPQDFPAEGFPVETVHRYTGFLQTHRVFATDQWADYLIFWGYPKQKVFFDGRSDFYSKGVSSDYLKLMQGAPGWQEILARYRIDAVLVPPSWPLAGFLKLQKNWRVGARNSQSILLTLQDAPGPALLPPP